MPTDHQIERMRREGELLGIVLPTPPRNARSIALARAPANIFCREIDTRKRRDRSQHSDAACRLMCVRALPPELPG